MARPIGVLLAGGRSRRFGGDKRHTLLGGLTLAERAASVLSVVADPVVVSVGSGDVEGLEGIVRVVDERPDEGPLSGVLAGLRYGLDRGHDGALVLAVDLPRVTGAHLGSLLAQLSSDADIVAAASSSDQRGQPLCGWYSTELVEPVERYLREGGRKVADFVAAQATRWVQFDPRVLTNVNTPEDLFALEAESRG